MAACRHRVAVFFKIASSLGFTVRHISNQCHAFIEINLNQQWLTFDFGGYANELNITPLIIDEDEPSDDEAKKTSDESLMSSSNYSTPEIILSNDNPFYTWKVKQLSFTTFLECNNYLDNLITKTDFLKQILCIFDTADSIFNLHLNFANYYKNSHESYGYFYIPNLNEIQKQELLLNSNHYNKLITIDSSLIQFIKHSHNRSILFINLEDGNPARLNALLDNERKLDDISLSQDVLIIADTTKQQALKQSEDFFSRFSILKNISSDFNSITELSVSNELSNQLALSNALTIEFYDGNNWEEILLGQITIAKQKALLTPGILLKAAQQNIDTLIFSHAPWENAVFNLFYQTLLQQKIFSCYGQRYHLPENLSIYNSDNEYSFKGQYALTFLNNNQDIFLYTIDYVLNSTLFNNFFVTYHCEGSDLIQLPSYFFQHKNQSITLLVTENLTSGKWAKLINEANNNHCFLNLILAQDINLPSQMLEQRTIKQPFEFYNFAQTYKNPDKLIYIQTTDIDYSVETHEHSIYQVINVTPQTTSADLFGSLQISTTDDPKDLRFLFKTTAIWQALAAGQNILIAGHLSFALAQELETIALTGYSVINGQNLIPKGRLFVVTDDSNFSKVIPIRHIDKPDQNAYWSYIASKQILSKSQLVKLQGFCESFQTSVNNWQWHYLQLKTITLSLLNMPQSNPLLPFLRLDNDAEMIKLAKTLWQLTKDKIADTSIDNENIPQLRPIFSHEYTKDNESSVYDSDMEVDSQKSVDRIDDNDSIEQSFDDNHAEYSFDGHNEDKDEDDKNRSVSNLSEEMDIQNNSSDTAHVEQQPIFFTYTDTLINTESFIAKRLGKIARLLMQQPFLFLVGPSGTGKTTFIKKELATFYKITYEEEVTVYIGEEQKINWLNDHSDNLKIYLADEINLEQPIKSDILKLFLQKIKY